MPKTDMNTQRRYFLSFLLVAALLLLSGCMGAWTVDAPAGDPLPVDAELWKAMPDFVEETDDGKAIPLEQILYQAGHQVADEVIITDSDGAEHRYTWADVVESAWWLRNGRISIAGDVIKPTALTATGHEWLADVQASITDIVPTISAALGVDAPAQATGHVLSTQKADHVALIFLDGFGYVRYTESLEAGLIPNLAALGEPLLALTTYPPATAVSTASLLTGAPPAVHGAVMRSIRKTDTETLFDVLAAAGRSAVAIEGNALAFNLRSVTPNLSGDHDGNGSTDDNVLANALAALDEGMPDLFFVHFHGIDDAGHTYGPNAPEEAATIQEVDAAVAQIIERLPADTMVILFADHGMHAVEEEGRLGNHGHLIPRDMYIPIFITAK